VSNCTDGTNAPENVLRADAPSGSWRKTATGVIGGFKINNRDTNPNCLADTEVYGSGVAILFVDGSGSITNKYVEMGYDLYHSTPDGFGPDWEGWADTGGGAAWTGNGCYGSCFVSLGATLGARCYFKINLVDGTTNWKEWVKCGSDTTYHLMVTFPNTGYTRGIPMSVTYRRGGIHTGMTDDVNSLQYRDSGGTFRSWAKNAAYPSFGIATDASNWKATSVTATSYTVVRS